MVYEKHSLDVCDGDSLDEYLFHEGTNFTAYRYLGCHAQSCDQGMRYVFRTWAPSAHSVSVIGDFLGDWERGIPMKRVSSRGIWEAQFISDKSLAGGAYKYRVDSRAGTHLKGDPYALFSRGGADGATVIVEESAYPWCDGDWFSHRRREISSRNGYYLSTPINIYEVHLGSFDRHDDESYLSYRELADVLLPYLKRMGYTHIELLPITEHPFDGSWGYQVCGFFAPTSRYGSPDDFRYFVDSMHRAGIGVLLDWVPAHFPKDEWGLYEFDGSPLYEYQGADRKESRSWGTRFFDLGREEIQSFLISSALFWLREYHIDGLRVDAVASMIYLDYDRMPGEWIPNAYGNNRNLEAIAFLRKLNKAVFEEFPDVLMIAEESTSFAGITHPVDKDGIGFNLKWNMGWANDLYDYLEMDPIYRKYHHKALNFPIMYAFGENYVLPISHDEVVHGKKSLIGKMHGEYDDKFRQMRTALLLQMTYPGKKMLFMGTEFAQFSEWNYKSGLEWFMLDYPQHRAMRDYVAALGHFYLSNRELWEIDFSADGFRWIDADDAARNLISFIRRAADGSELIVILTFSGDGAADVRIPAAKNGRYNVVFESFGTGEKRSEIPAKKDAGGWHIKVSLPPFSGIVLRLTGYGKQRRILFDKKKTEDAYVL